MNILLISQVFWPENFRINDWVIGMEERGHNVTVLTGEPNYPAGTIYPEYSDNPSGYNKFSETDIIRVPIIPRGKKKWQLAFNYLSFLLSASCIGLFKIRNKKFDVCFVYGVSPITVVIPAILQKKIKRTPIVLWVLDLWPESLRVVGVVKSNSMLKFLGYGVKYLYSKCDLILGQSQAFKNSIQKQIPNHQNVKYAPNWSDQKPSYQNNIVENLRVKNTDVFTVLFTGNVGDAQDFNTIVCAAEMLRYSNIELLIVGSGSQFSWLENQINDKKLDSILKTLGAYPVERMPYFYNIADAFLVTLKEDKIIEKTVPGKIHAYLAFGKPIIGAVDGEAAKILNEAGCAKVGAAGNAEILAANILELSLESKEKLKLMSLNAQKYYQNEFEREKVLDNFEAFLFKTVAKY